MINEDTTKLVKHINILKQRLKHTMMDLNEQRRKTKNLEQIIEKDIKHAKTFRLWQMYCRMRDYIFNTLHNPSRIIKLINYIKFSGVLGILQKQEYSQFQSGYLDKKSYSLYRPSSSLKKSIPDKVSVIIPTRNGGKEFEKNLLSIIKQKGVEHIEVIVVDNYSDDQTVKIALDLGCTITKIKNFSHSASRNLGARLASGEYIIFTVQDAYFADTYSFCKLINFIKINNLAGASGYQVPYENADTFAKWQFKRHYDFMNPKRQNIIFKGSYIAPRFNLFSFLTKRKFLNIDDVFSCLKIRVFKQYYFSEKIGFAEDADLASKLLQNRYNIGFASFSKVYHSHNRDFIYHFKRTFADLCSLNSIFKDVFFRIKGKYKENIYLIMNLMILLELNLNSEHLWENIENGLKHPVPDKLLQKSLFYSRFQELFNKLHFKNGGYFIKEYFPVYKADINVNWKIYRKYCFDNHFQIQNNDLLKVAAVLLAGYLGEVVGRLNNFEVKKTLNLLTDSV